MQANTIFESNSNVFIIKLPIFYTRWCCKNLIKSTRMFYINRFIDGNGMTCSRTQSPLPILHIRMCQTTVRVFFFLIHDLYETQWIFSCQINTTYTKLTLALRFVKPNQKKNLNLFRNLVFVSIHFYFFHNTRKTEHFYDFGFSLM